LVIVPESGGAFCGLSAVAHAAGLLGFRKLSRGNQGSQGRGLAKLARITILARGRFQHQPTRYIMARKGSLEAERAAIAKERQALETREAKLRENEQAAMAELLKKSALGKAPFERVEGFFAALGKLGLDEAEKRLRIS
jgi:hypothetical protein